MKYRASHWGRLHLTFQSDSLLDLGTVKLLPLHLLVEKLEVPTAPTERNQKGRSEGGEREKRGKKKDFSWVWLAVCRMLCYQVTNECHSSQCLQGSSDKEYHTAGHQLSVYTGFMWVWTRNRVATVQAQCRKGEGSFPYCQASRIPGPETIRSGLSGSLGQHTRGKIPRPWTQACHTRL